MYARLKDKHENKLFSKVFFYVYINLFIYITTDYKYYEHYKLCKKIKTK